MANDDFFVCSFGLMGATKLNERLLEAWLLSPLSQDARCRLVFVGECPKNEYGNQLLKRIKESGAQRHIQITGLAEHRVHAIEMGLGTAIGAITFTGSVIAFAKLNGNMSGAPIMLPGRHVINLGTLAAIIGLIGLYTVSPDGGAGEGWMVIAVAVPGLMERWYRSIPLYIMARLWKLFL